MKLPLLAVFALVSVAHCEDGARLLASKSLLNRYAVEALSRLQIDPEICLFLPLPLSLRSPHGCSSCQSSMVVPVVSCDTLFPTQAAPFLGFVKIPFYYQDLTKDLSKIKQDLHHAGKKLHLQNEKLTEQNAGHY
uniref:Uncharacterized protein n=1 Tax=Serinus canaria TaxID=9135 RepID=A0A8C9KWF1_SERCA